MPAWLTARRAVDGAEWRHYVTPTADTSFRTDLRLRLLLLLSALIAGMTGLIAGAPAAARASEPTAIAAVLGGSADQASETAEARTVVRASYDPRVATRDVRSIERVLRPQLHPVDERRIE